MIPTTHATSATCIRLGAWRWHATAAVSNESAADRNRPMKGKPPQLVVPPPVLTVHGPKVNQRATAMLRPPITHRTRTQAIDARSVTAPRTWSLSPTSSVLTRRPPLWLACEGAPKKWVGGT